MVERDLFIFLFYHLNFFIFFLKLWDEDITRESKPILNNVRKRVHRNGLAQLVKHIWTKINFIIPAKSSITI